MLTIIDPQNVSHAVRTLLVELILRMQHDPARTPVKQTSIWTSIAQKTHCVASARCTPDRISPHCHSETPCRPVSAIYVLHCACHIYWHALYSLRSETSVYGLRPHAPLAFFFGATINVAPACRLGVAEGDLGLCHMVGWASTISSSPGAMSIFTSM